MPRHQVSLFKQDRVTDGRGTTLTCSATFKADQSTSRSTKLLSFCLHSDCGMAFHRSIILSEARSTQLADRAASCPHRTSRQ